MILIILTQHTIRYKEGQSAKSFGFAMGGCMEQVLCPADTTWFNSKHAELLLKIIKLYLNFLSFPDTKMARVIESLPCATQGPCLFPVIYAIADLPGAPFRNMF